MAKNVYTKEERRKLCLASGLKMAKKSGVDKVTLSAVAAEQKVTAPLLFHIFGNRDKFRAAIKAEAKRQGVELPGAVAPTRKRAVKEVKAIKDKAAGKRPVAKKAPAKAPAAKRAPAAPATKRAPAAPATKRAPAAKKAPAFPTLPAPEGVVIGEAPKASI